MEKPIPSRNVCRRLFDVDHDYTSQLLDSQKQAMYEQFKEKWNFDVVKEKPLPGKYKWELVSRVILDRSLSRRMIVRAPVLPSCVLDEDRDTRKDPDSEVTEVSPPRTSSPPVTVSSAESQTPPSTQTTPSTQTPSETLQTFVSSQTCSQTCTQTPSTPRTSVKRKLNQPLISEMFQEKKPRTTSKH